MPPQGVCAKDGLEVGHSLDTKNAFENGVVTGDFAVLEAIGPAPYREHELGDELIGCVAPVGAQCTELKSLESVSC